MLIRREIEFVGKNLLSPISPLNGYSKSFGNNILEEVVDYEIFSLATSGEKESLIEQNIKKLFKVDLPFVGKSNVSENKKLRVMAVSLDQWFVLSNSGNLYSKLISNASFPDNIYVTIQTDAWVILRVSGTSALKALERICPVNLDPKIFQKNDMVRTMMEHLGSIVICEEKDSYLLLSASSSAKSFLHSVEVSLKNVI